jgi:hypothetical protein
VRHVCLESSRQIQAEDVEVSLKATPLNESTGDNIPRGEERALHSAFRAWISKAPGKDSLVCWRETKCK